MTDDSPLLLQSHQLRQDASGSVLSGWVDGVELYFRVGPGHELVSGVEPFLCAMLMPAMAQGRDIVVTDDSEIHDRFLDSLGRLQDIYRLWYPELRRVDIRVRTRSASSSLPRTGRALFFSGGLDACFSLKRHADSLDALVYVRGIDMRLDQEALYRQCLDSNREIADAFGKTLVAVESNVRFFIRTISRSELGWGMAQGCGLAGIAHALGFPVILVSSSNTYDNLQPYGSHPLTDPLLSSDKVGIVHVGSESRRHEKLLSVAEDDFLLQRVRVCWQDKGLNCGVCDKCLHFRLALTLIGLRSRHFAPLTDYAELAGAHIGTPGEYAEWDDNIRLARMLGHTTAARALHRRLRRFRTRQIVQLIDETWFGGRLRRLRRRVVHRSG